MNEKKFKELLAFLKTTDLHEIMVQKKDVSVHLRRNPRAVAAAPGTSPAPAAAPDASNALPEAPAAAPQPTVICSTMVGTFFRSDSAERPPFVVEGAVVHAGQSVGAIEAMKIMKDVVAPSSCKIVKALVANGHAVEYGQPLFEIEQQPEHV